MSGSQNAKQRGIGWRLAMCGLLILAGWLIYLNFSITAKFDGRRWDLPAQVYARPLELYAGLALDVARLERELLRLGYQSTTEAPQQPGSFRPSRRGIDLVTREFRFWDARQPALSLRVEFNGPQISRLQTQNRDTAIVRLSPLSMVHDFMITSRHLVIVFPPLDFERLDAPVQLTKAVLLVKGRNDYAHINRLGHRFSSPASHHASAGQFASLPKRIAVR